MQEVSEKKMSVIIHFAQQAWFPGRPQERNTPVASARHDPHIPMRTRGRERRQASRHGRELLPAIGIGSVFIELRAGLHTAIEHHRICGKQVQGTPSRRKQGLHVQGTSGQHHHHFHFPKR